MVIINDERMESNDVRFVGVVEAMTVTGKSQSTMQRLIRKYKGSEYIKYKGKKPYVSVVLLSSEYGVTSVDSVGKVVVDNQDEIGENRDSHDCHSYSALLDAKDEMISLLKTELEQKNKQLSDLTETVKGQMLLNKELQSKIAALPEKTQFNIQDTQFHQDVISDGEIEHKIDQNINFIKDMSLSGASPKEIAWQLNDFKLLNLNGEVYTEFLIKQLLENQSKI